MEGVWYLWKPSASHLRASQMQTFREQRLLALPSRGTSPEKRKLYAYSQKALSGTAGAGVEKTLDEAASQGEEPSLAASLSLAEAAPVLPGYSTHSSL